jgi:hypothetical protein
MTAIRDAQVCHRARVVDLLTVKDQQHLQQQP